MKVLICHNHYQGPGGEDHCFAEEGALLESHGHEVVRYRVHNDALHGMNRWKAAAGTIWSRASFHKVRSLIRRERPSLMHCTNTFPLLSPSIYYAARREGVPVVQSLHNYRILCPDALLLRDGKVCEQCLLKRFAWPGIVHGCYRGSRCATAVVAGMSTVHRLCGTWRNAVDLYLTPSMFARREFIKAGFAAHKIAVKPNFIDPDPGSGDGSGGYALFVGRLSAEKGIATLLQAWRSLGDLPLKLVGDGPLAQDVQQAAREIPGVEWLGGRSHAEVLELVGRARWLLMPSICYETFGRTIVEAFAKGTPVIASRMGSMQELVDDGRNGWLFNPGDANDLVRVVREAQQNSGADAEFRQAARTTYERGYTGDENYRLLIALYEQAAAAFGGPIQHPVQVA